MRKWFYAGAVVGSLLLGAAPAHADDVAPSPVGDLTGLTSTADAGQGLGQGLGLNPAGGGLGLVNPLGGGNLVAVKPGNNSADLSDVTSRVSPQSVRSLREADEPADRMPATGVPAEDQPGAGGG
ncbi:hypothetical protein, partial [Couchioplanes caeruleus]|uniref:hypothetical protein n=1 Tax=Couchioplanes caeruleus TaxID=56438 RepID=UPI001B80765A